MTSGGPARDIRLVDNVAHRDLAVRFGPSADLGDAQRFVPLIPGEFAAVATHCPIFLAKSGDTGAFYFGALLGFFEGENLLLSPTGHDGQRPLYLQRMPFCTAGEHIAIDFAHPRVGAPGAEPIFAADGAPSPAFAAIIDSLGQIRAGEGQARTLIDALLAQQLVEPVELDIQFDDGQRLNAQGLYRVNRARFAALDDAVIVDWFRRGHIHLVEIMIQSHRQVPVMIERRNARLAGRFASAG